MSLMVEAIFGTKVSPAMLKAAVTALAEMDPDERRDLTGRALAIIRVLDEKGWLGTEPHLTAAIEFRLEALARLSDRPELKAWSLPGDIDGMVYVQPVVWDAAAAEPLREEEDRPAFDPDSFFKRLTALSDPAGRA